MAKKATPTPTASRLAAERLMREVRELLRPPPRRITPKPRKRVSVPARR